MSLGRTWETAWCFILSVKDTMEKSAFSPAPPLSCSCPCPEALLRSSCGAFGFILRTQVLILLLDIVLNGVVYGTRGSAPRSSLVALVLFLMEIQSFLPDSVYCCMLFLWWGGLWPVCGTSGKYLALHFSTPGSSAAAIPEPKAFKRLCVWMMRWDNSHLTASSLISVPSPVFNVPLLSLVLGS